MSVLDLLKKKIKLVSILVTREELKSVLASTVLEPPQGARYKIGDIIHPAGGNSLGKLKVYGVKAGGYGFVYIVLEEETLNPYCLKTFQDRLFAKSDKSGYFTREAETWIKLEKHPNIVYADSVVSIGGRPYIVLEYVAGSELWSKIRNGPMPVSEALKYAIQICRGMVHAQNKLPGFIHGDIKPNNCLLTKDGTLKITDFGLARVWAERAETPVRRTVSLSSESLEPPIKHWGAGTPPYMAPEQFDASLKRDTRSDIYSFGVTLFEMLTGRRPFAGSNYQEWFEQHRRATVPDPAALNADIPRPLADLVLKCLKKHPAERPDNFSVVEHELSVLLSDIYKDEVPQVSHGQLSIMERINRGVSLLALSRYDEALACFDELLTTKPQFSRVWGHKGDALSACGRHDEALACFDRALAMDPRLAFVWASKGRTLSALGRRDEALACFDRALALDPQLALVWSCKGRVLNDQGRLVEAIICFKRAFTDDPQFVEAHYNLGLTYWMLGRDDEAIASYKQAVALKPDYAEAHFGLGKTYASLRRFKPAIESYRRALDILPGYQEAKSALSEAYGKFYCGTDRFVSNAYAERLIAFLSDGRDTPEVIVGGSIDFLELSNFDPVVLYLCGDRIYRATGKMTGEQKEAFSRTLTEVWSNINQHEQDWETFYWLGKIYYGLDLYGDCQQVCQQSISRFGADDRSLYYIAASNEMTGNHEAALNYYKQALPFDPDCSLTLSGIARMEAQVAQKSAAANAAKNGFHRG